jgi:hypothetical protein
MLGVLQGRAAGSARERSELTLCTVGVVTDHVGGPPGMNSDQEEIGLQPRLYLRQMWAGTSDLVGPLSSLSARRLARDGLKRYDAIT